MKIKYVKGDATAPRGKGLKAIAHISNDIGAWGAGFVLALSNKWNYPEEFYRAVAAEKGLTLGDVHIVPVERNIVVMNMVAQAGIGFNDGVAPIRYDALRTCLNKVNEHCVMFGGTLHAPRFGAGLAGGDWNIIEGIILDVMDVDVTIYDFN